MPPNHNTAAGSGERTVESVKAEIRELCGREPTWRNEWMLDEPGGLAAFMREHLEAGSAVADLLCWLDAHAPQEAAHAR